MAGIEVRRREGEGAGGRGARAERHVGDVIDVIENHFE